MWHVRKGQEISINTAGQLSVVEGMSVDSASNTHHCQVCVVHAVEGLGQVLLQSKVCMLWITGCHVAHTCNDTRS